MKLTYTSQPFFNEFLMDVGPDVDDLIARCVAGGILPGVKIAPGRMLIAVTEMLSRADLDRLVEFVEQM